MPDREDYGMNSVPSAFSGILFFLKDRAFPIQTALSSLARRGHCVVTNLSQSSLHSTLRLHGEDLKRRGFSQSNVK